MIQGWCGMLTRHGVRGGEPVGPVGRGLASCILRDGGRDQAIHGKETGRTLA